MKIDKIMVIGAGQMGSGIAQVCAQAGFKVLLHDLKTEFVEKGLSVIKKNLARQVAKERMTEAELENILGNITPSTELRNAGTVDLVIEAAVENMEIKAELLRS